MHQQQYNTASCIHRPPDDEPPNMRAWAIAYARRNYRVFPLHEPLFDHPQGYRCSCEEYRHSEECRQRDAERTTRNLPPLHLEAGQHCDQPGKHPRVAWRTKATTDEKQIRTWWHKWPAANIGLAGYPLLILDADLYKDNYAGETLLNLADMETVSSRTGGGGRHLWFTMPAGKTWGNGKGNTPDGIDIRGQGGYIVAPPSLHASGRRYAFEDGRSLADRTPAPVPAALAAMLDLAYARKTTATAVAFSTPPGAAPNLAQWSLSDNITDLIHVGACHGRRSEADMSVIVALCFAGATDDEIRAVFAHNPIGSKYRERGDEYLARSIGAARQWVAEQPSPERNRAHIDKLREFVRRADLAEHVPVMKQSDAGYRTRDTDTAVADAILDIAHEYGRLTRLALPLRKLRALAGLGSPNTAAAALDRLLSWFVVPHLVAERKETQAQLYDIAPELVAWAEEQLEVANIARNSTPVAIERLSNIGETRAIYATSPLVTHRRRDAFIASMTPISEEELQARVDARQAEISEGLDVKPIDRSRYRRRLAAVLPSAGRGVLRMIDALVTDSSGACEKRKLRELLNVTAPTLSRLIARARVLGLVDADRRTVTLHEQWRELIDAFEPYMPTAGRADELDENDDNARIAFAERVLNRPTGCTAEEERYHRKAIRLCAERKQRRAEQLRPDLAHDHADVAPPSVHDRLAQIRLAEAHAQARLDLATERKAEQWRLPLEVQRLRRDGISRGDAWRMLNMGGWSKAEISGAMEAAWPRQEVRP